MRAFFSLRGARPLSTDAPIHCLAVRVECLPNGEVDTDELEEFLDGSAGPNQWLVTSAWMFARAPQAPRPEYKSVPVICPATVAVRLHLAACARRAPRVFGEHVVSAVELRGWRWVAAEVYPQFAGRFPWELEARAIHDA